MKIKKLRPSLSAIDILHIQRMQGKRKFFHEGPATVQANNHKSKYADSPHLLQDGGNVGTNASASGGSVRIRCLLWLAFLLCAASCQRIMFDEEEEMPSAGGNVPLKISTRSNGDTQINYPAYIYAFQPDDGTCAASRQIADEADAVELSLLPGRYTVVALSGVGEEYVLPEEPSLSDVITMKSDNYQSHCALMMGQAIVSVSENQNTSVDITLYHVVSMVNVSLNGIPSAATDVRISLSPLYSTLSFSGAYAGGGMETEAVCVRSSNGTTWTAGPFYIFPGSDEHTLFSIQMNVGGDNKRYSYTYNGRPEANVPFDIRGNYMGDVTIEGNLTKNDWNPSVDADFDFGERVNNDDDEQPAPSGSIEIGEIYENGIIGDITYSDSERADFLLMSLQEWECYAGDANTLLGDSLRNGWSYPTEAEARTLHKELGEPNLEKVNERIQAAGSGYELISNTERYLCVKDNYFYAFGFYEGSTIREAGTNVKYKIRLVRQVNLVYKK